ELQRLMVYVPDTGAVKECHADLLVATHCPTIPSPGLAALEPACSTPTETGVADAHVYWACATAGRSAASAATPARMTPTHRRLGRAETHQRIGNSLSLRKRATPEDSSFRRCQMISGAPPQLGR